MKPQALSSISATDTRKTRRMVSDTGVLDIREVSGFVPVPGVGVPHHVDFRARSVDAVRSIRKFMTGSISCSFMSGILLAYSWNMRPMILG